VFPEIRTSEKVLKRTAPGYCEALCERIGKVVIAAVEEPERKISVHFNDGVAVEISLLREDRIGAEAAMFQDGSGKLWRVW
jgi:hypothetical protein